MLVGIICTKLVLLLLFQESHQYGRTNWSQVELYQMWSKQLRVYNGEFGCKPWPFIEEIDNNSPAGALFPSSYLIKKCAGYCSGGISSPMSMTMEDFLTNGHHGVQRYSTPRSETCQPTSTRTIEPMFRFEDYAADKVSYKKISFTEHVACECKPI